MSIYSHEAFVYRWTNLSNGKIYIGKHKGTSDDGYISSGKAFLQVYNQNPQDFVRDILFEGPDHIVLQKEQELIKEYIAKNGHESMYNLTCWDYLKEWSITCTHCGSKVDPRNEEWLVAFEAKHFDNCTKAPGYIDPKDLVVCYDIPRPKKKSQLSYESIKEKRSQEKIKKKTDRLERIAARNEKILHHIKYKWKGYREEDFEWVDGIVGGILRRKKKC